MSNHASQHDLFRAESILRGVAMDMESEVQAYGAKWGLDRLKEHAKDQEILIRARNILIERTGMGIDG